MRSLDECASPDQYAIDAPPVQSDGSQTEPDLCAIPPYDQVDLRCLREFLDLPVGVDDLPVYLQQQIDGLELRSGRRHRNQTQDL